MVVARSFHTSALLLDGRVLVLGGGDDKNQVLASAEVYDPATRTFTRVGDMSQPRWDTTATTLLDGRVLVVGGYRTPDASSALLTAELFDPATGKFQPTGSVQNRRNAPTALRLSDGRVAILGDASAVEIYDPKTGIFSTQGETTTRRRGVAVLSVPGNKILLAGGFFGQSVLDSIEIYEWPRDRPRSSATYGAAVGGCGFEFRPWSHSAGRRLHRRKLAQARPHGCRRTDRSGDRAEASPAAKMNRPRAEGVGILLQDGRALILGVYGDLIAGQSARGVRAGRRGGSGARRLIGVAVGSW